MKKILLSLAIIGVSFFSCRNTSKNGNSENNISTEKIKKNDTTIAECYQYITEKDTVLIQLREKDNKVEGNLSYNYFEKDKNNGIFEGTMKGDTLLANYTFNAEGRVSTREVIFLKKENSLIEGYGDVEEINGKFQFKEQTQFSFNENMPLKKVKCSDN